MRAAAVDTSWQAVAGRPDGSSAWVNTVVGNGAPADGSLVGGLTAALLAPADIVYTWIDIGETRFITNVDDSGGLQVATVPSVPVLPGLTEGRAAVLVLRYMASAAGRSQSAWGVPVDGSGIMLSGSGADAVAGVANPRLAVYDTRPGGQVWTWNRPLTDGQCAQLARGLSLSLSRSRLRGRAAWVVAA